MKNKFILTLFLAAFLLSACKKTESEKVDTKTENKSPEKFTIDSLKINDSVKINDKLSVNYASKILVFPTLKDKALLDSIYYDKTGITDYSKQGLQNFLDKDKTEFYTSVKEDSKEWISDIQNPQTWETGSFMKLISQNNDFLQIEYLHTSTRVELMVIIHLMQEFSI
ncbi:hypothetical protein [Chryseobacterium indoltheticum]|uniref:hypothetical protein n=1 Tax=Chryseobacterium indoltheticum TaxID=254 RepID=UPI003F4912EC